MSGYQPGRRGPNVSQYIAGLNQIPQENDFLDDYNFEDDLALFTNTEFLHNDTFDLDFDFAQAIIPGEEDFIKQQQQQTLDITGGTATTTIPTAAAANNTTTETAAISSPLHHSPPLPPVKTITKKQKLSPRSTTKPITASISTSTEQPSISLDTSAVASANKTTGAKAPLSISVPTIDNTSSLQQQQEQQPQPASSQVGDGDMNFDGDFHFTDIGFTPQGNIANHNPYVATPTTYDFNISPQSPYDPKHQLNTPVTTPPNGQQGIRPQGVLPDAAALLEASSRAAAEEDKRRRNTAASARFRSKKKQREQALERSAKDMTDKLDKLEDRIHQLEKENTWLRGLVVERTAKTSEEMAELYKTFKEETSKDSHKKGVGTLKAEN